MCYVIV